MRILDRYIFASVLAIFFGCLLTFLFLYVIIDLFANLDMVMKQHVNILLLAQYYLASVPVIFVQVVPIACLLATLYTFAKLNRDNEIIAMRASGLSIFQISRTVIIFGFILSLAVFFVNDRFVPQSASVTKRFREQMESGAKKLKAKKREPIKNFFMYGSKNRLIYANSFSPDTDTLDGIVILEHDAKQNVTEKIMAQKGVYEKGFWRFYNCYTFVFEENGRDIKEQHYQEEEIMTITETPKDFLDQRQSPEFMTIAQLDNYIWRLSRSGATKVTRNFKIDLYQRFTMPLTTILIILLGIPFSLMIRKRATGISSLGISIMVGFLYYVVNAVSVAFGKAGFLPPGLAVSLSHILALMFSLYLMWSLP